MTILAALFAATLHGSTWAASAAEPVPAATQALEEEIVVVANRLNDWRGQATFMNKRPRCKTIKSTGDARIDRIGCDAMTRCVVETRDAFAIRDKGKPKTSASDTAEWRRTMGECVRTQRLLGLRAYVAARRGG
jgi:ferredoxin